MRLGEYVKRSADIGEARAERHRAAVAEILGNLRDRTIAPYPGSIVSETVCLELRTLMARSPDKVDILPVECDHCGTPLVDPQSGVALMTSPPQRHARCPGCGFCGYMPL